MAENDQAAACHSSDCCPHCEVLARICAESYQVMGILADEAGRFNDPAVVKALDNASRMELEHDDVLPFPCHERSGGVGLAFPRHANKDENWVIDSGFLVRLKRHAKAMFGDDFYRESLDMEQIEQVLLALETLDSPPTRRNYMNTISTPRTDAHMVTTETGGEFVPVEFARQLERELIAATQPGFGATLAAMVADGRATLIKASSDEFGDGTQPHRQITSENKP